MNEITIGNKIADGRKAKGLSQAQFAEMLNISKQAVGKWERGESMPDIIMLGKIANIIGVDANHFLSDGENLKKATADRKPKVKNMSFMSLKDADFSGLDNLKEKLSCANIERCKFVGADLKNILFKSNNLKDNDFSDASMEGSKFVSANVERNNFTGVNLQGLETRSSNIVKNNFTNADLTNVVFKSSNIKDNNFVGAKIDGAEFCRSNLTAAKFSGQMTNCIFTGCNFKKTEFVDVTFDNVFFKNNAKNAIFTNCKADNITYAFLKSAKADLSSMTIIPRK